MARIILIAILIYLGYLFIFRFLIPVYFASRRFKKGFREMKERMEQQMRQQQGFQTEPDPAPRKNTPPKEDYLEYEEVK